MAHQHQRAGTTFRHMHLDPVHRDDAVADLGGHGVIRWRMISSENRIYFSGSCSQNERPGSTRSFGLAGSVCFDTTTEGTSARSTSQSLLMRSRKRLSV